MFGVPSLATDIPPRVDPSTVRSARAEQTEGLVQFRHLFDVPRDISYLNCAYLSPLLHDVRMAGETALALLRATLVMPAEAVRSSMSTKIGRAPE